MSLPVEIGRFIAEVVVVFALTLLAACNGRSEVAPTAAPSAPVVSTTTRPATETSLSFVSAAGEWVGSGQTKYITPSSAPIVAGIDCYRNRIEIRVGTPPGSYWTLTLAATVGQPLVVGTYDFAERYPFNSNGHPGMDFNGEHQGCNNLTGSFEVTEAVFQPNRQVERFRARFSQRCEGTSPGVSGEIQLISPTYSQVSC